MTGISIFKTDKKAFLLSDEGCFCPDTGKLLYHATKGLGFEAKGLAIAFSGNGVAADLIPAMNRILPANWTQAEFLEALPAILRDRHSEIETCIRPDAESRIFVAMIERPSKRPRLFFLSSHAVEFLPGVAPFELTEVEGLAVPAIDFTDLFPRGYIKGTIRDARRIVTAQRHIAFDSLAGGVGISGNCELLTISRGGIKLNNVAKFPDPIGGRIAEPNLTSDDGHQLQ
jgi:hypothetical protein